MERVATHPAVVLEEARAAGFTVVADGDRLTIRGPTSRRDLAEQLLADKAGVLAVLADEVEAEIAWRVAAMTPQVPGVVPIPFLVARPCELGSGGCLSCGAPMEAGQQYRCRTCAEAARRVVAADEAERTVRREQDGGRP